MDAEIAAVARAGSVRTGSALNAPRGAAADRPCPRYGDDYCARFTLFASRDVCDACKSPDPSARAAAVQRLRSVSDGARPEPPACRHRSAPMTYRPGRNSADRIAVHACRRDRRKVTTVNCALCADRETTDGPCSGDGTFRVLNLNVVPQVPTIPTAEPEVRVMVLHGECVAFDANSLCAVHMDEGTAQRLNQKNGRAFHGLLFSRNKPQFRLSRGAPARRVVLNVTHACNLACGYCFAGGHQSGARMTVETARKAMALIDPRSTVDLAFFGGEPLLEWGLIGQVMREARALAAKRGVKARFHITTNGVLLDEEKVAFLSEQPCSLLVSLDGPEEMHNAARPARDEKVNSFDATMNALARAKGTPLGKRTMARATFDAADARLVERLEFFAGLNDDGLIQGYSVEPAVLGEGCARRQSASAEASADRSAIRGEYHAAAAWFVSRVRAGRSANFFHFRKLTGRIAHAKHCGTECGAGNGYITVGPDGTIHACHREAGTGIGHVDYGIDEQLRAAWADNRLYARSACGRCWARHLCGGGCRQACLELAGDLRAVAPERCFLQQTLLRECLWILTQLDKDEIARSATP